jgi:hypothetical protein
MLPFPRTNFSLNKSRRLSFKSFKEALNLRFYFLAQIFALGWLVVSSGVETYFTTNSWKVNSQSDVMFRENKGQVYDQNGRPRPDVLYFGNAGTLHVHFKTSGLSYQMFNIEKSIQQNSICPTKGKNGEDVLDVISVYRTDLYRME